MITVQIVSQKDKLIGLVATGHAGSGPTGQDIVCAAFSALSIGIINGIHALTNGKIQHEDDGEMFQAKINNPDNDTELLMKTFVMSIEAIQQQYPKNLYITRLNLKG